MFYRLVFLSCLLSITYASWAVPYLPKSDDEILEQLPFKPNDPAMREIRELRSAVAAEPRESCTGDKARPPLLRAGSRAG